VLLYSRQGYNSRAGFQWSLGFSLVTSLRFHRNAHHIHRGTFAVYIQYFVINLSAQHQHGANWTQGSLTSRFVQNAYFAPCLCFPSCINPVYTKAALHVIKAAIQMHLQHVPAAQGASASSQWGHTQTLERLLGKQYPGPGHMTRFPYHQWCSHCSSAAADLKMCNSAHHHLSSNTYNEAFHFELQTMLPCMK